MSETVQIELKYVYRLPPCPAYDVEGTESWLSDMAAQGFILSRDGFFAGFAIFEKAEPLAMRYRLEPAPKKISMWSDDNGNPSDEAMELSEAYGWQYVASRGQFHIYYSDLPDACELNTDPKVQAIALDMVRKRERANVITSIFWIAIYPAVLLQGKLLLLTVSTGTWLMLWAAVLVFWASWRSVSKVAYLNKLCKKLALGEMPDHNKNWKQYVWCYRLSGIALFTMVIAWLGFVIIGWSNELLDGNVHPFEEYSGEFPFATIADLAPEGEYRMIDTYTANTVETRSDWLAPTIIELCENAQVNFGPRESLSGGLYVDYYDTIAPWVAREIAREYIAQAKRSKYYQEYNLIDLDVAYAVAYLDHFPTIIVQQGNKVMKVTFYQTSSTYTMPMDEWVQIFADSMK